ncbi:glycoside hydrolase family 18 protein [Coniophora puteana RWD-64-598 SS2]|uniref:chitinase n=1 Tax=Coniophora puteana (strain RWD-64-598) TaxID=741705 RepID=A0A5M3MMV6_CONPW|nr:glycoside hydrolase family 18 protein [Coniophora puteana RWD-64-598 SS2]EIW80350.1 glycoside hydrolase family 18 protein [Coniophora puteana RWD-64-598 SS2]
MFTQAFTTFIVGASLLGLAAPAMAFDMSANTNLAVYWGQNSYGATHTSDTANWQQPIEYYCQDDSIDTIPIAFVIEFFGTGNIPVMNLANTCNNVDNSTFSGTDMPDCSALAAGIEACQAKGKTVTISLGGATGAIGFTSDSQAQTFAQTIWDLYLGGSSTTRPFGAAVLDGVDLDIEGGSTTGYSAFVTALRTLMDGGDKSYYITAAPQCPFPDAYLGTTLDEVGFDAVYVQFYNNYCGVNDYGNSNDWDYSLWDNWATNTSPNKNVKVYIGAPASSTAANSGYVDAATLGSILQATKAQYASFGGAMLWDASQAYANGRYDQAIKSALGGGSSAPSSTSSAPTSTTAPTSTASTATSSAPSPTTTSSGTCTGVSAWSSSTAYTGGSQVTYNGSLWTASWWTEGDTPGGSAGVWTSDGTCASLGRRASRLFRL